MLRCVETRIGPDRLIRRGHNLSRVMIALAALNLIGCSEREAATSPHAAQPSTLPRARGEDAPQIRHPKPSGVGADFDGDGRRDAVRLFARCDGAQRPCSSHVRVRMRGEGVHRFPFEDCSGQCAVEGASDFDGDGRRELVVNVGPGAAITLWRAYRVDTTGLVPLVFNDPAYGSLDPPYAVFGGSHDAIAESGFACRTRRAGQRVVVAWQASRNGAAANDPWRAEITVFRLDGEVFQAIGSRVRRLPGEYPLAPHVRLCP